MSTARTDAAPYAATTAWPGADAEHRDVGRRRSRVLGRARSKSSSTSVEASPSIVATRARSVGAGELVPLQRWIRAHLRQRHVRIEGGGEDRAEREPCRDERRGGAHPRRHPPARGGEHAGRDQRRDACREERADRAGGHHQADRCRAAERRADEIRRVEPPDLAPPDREEQRQCHPAAEVQRDEPQRERRQVRVRGRSVDLAEREVRRGPEPRVAAQHHERQPRERHQPRHQLAAPPVGAPRRVHPRARGGQAELRERHHEENEVVEEPVRDQPRHRHLGVEQRQADEEDDQRRGRDALRARTRAFHGRQSASSNTSSSRHSRRSGWSFASSLQ